MRARRGPPAFDLAFREPRRGADRRETQHLAQVVCQLSRVGIPIRPVLREALPDDFAKTLGNVARHEARVRRLLVKDLVNERRQGVCREGFAQRQRLIQDDAEGEDVGSGVQLFALDLLGRHVRGRTHHLTGGRELRVADQELPDPEVRDLRRKRRREQDVRGLHVAVQHPALVRVREGLGHFGHDADPVAHREARGVGQALREAPPLYELHGEVERALILADVEHRHDVRVRQAGRRTRLVQEQGVERGALLGRDLHIEGLDGDQPRQQRVVRGVHRTEPALADAELQRVAADVADGGHRVAGRAVRMGRKRSRRRGREAHVGVAPQGDVGQARSGRGLRVVGRARRVGRGAGKRHRSSLVERLERSARKSAGDADFVTPAHHCRPRVCMATTAPFRDAAPLPANAPSSWRTTAARSARCRRGRSRAPA